MAAASKQKVIFYSCLIGSCLLHFVYLILRWTSSGCEDHTTKEDFDVESYMGTWYEFVRSDNIPFEKGVCI